MIRPLIQPPVLPQAPRQNKLMWLISFTDLLSLLLGFFVLLYSMSEPRQERWNEMVKGLSARSTAATYSERAPKPTAAFNGASIETHSRVDLGYLAALLRGQMRERPELDNVALAHEDDRVVLGIPIDTLFERDSRVLSDDGRKVLFLLGSVMARSGNRIEVTGHAENGTTGGASWEAALIRAVAVSAALRDMGYGSDLVARAVSQPASQGMTGTPRLDIVIREQEG